MTTEPLDLDRFRTLADAYGAAIARWPEDVRDAARRMAMQPAARMILVEAEALDRTLDRWSVEAPAASLHARLLPAAHPLFGGWRRARLWWSGIGIAAALAGTVAGSVAAAAIAPAAPPTESATAFGDIGGES